MFLERKTMSIFSLRPLFKAFFAVFCALPLLSGCAFYFLEKDPNEIALGATAPEFSLAQAFSSEEKSLSQLKEEGQVLLVFYRGYW